MTELSVTNKIYILLMIGPTGITYKHLEIHLKLITATTSLGWVKVWVNVENGYLRSKFIHSVNSGFNAPWLSWLHVQMIHSLWRPSDSNFKADYSFPIKLTCDLVNTGKACWKHTNYERSITSRRVIQHPPADTGTVVSCKLVPCFFQT